MTSQLPLALLRLLIGIGLLGSVFWQVSDRVANGLFRPLEYFAYFSIVSSIAAGAVLLLSGISLVKGQLDGKWREIAKLSLTVAMVIVGIVYHLLLADAAPDVRDQGYQWPVFPNEVIHTYAPILIVVEYLLSQSAFRIRLRAFLWVAIYPLSWLVLTVLRGLVDGWWPYWFINPTGEGGLTGMLSYVAGITGLFLVMGFLMLGSKQLVGKVFSKA